VFEAHDLQRTEGVNCNAGPLVVERSVPPLPSHGTARLTINDGRRHQPLTSQAAAALTDPMTT
jgi:hypothetical protein